MRYLQILLCLTISFLLSTTAKAERPPQAPPVDERLTGIESRLADHETRLNVLEGKSPTTAKSCPCPNGPCICDPGNCNCLDCPEHVGTRLDAKLRILAFHADWCGPCKTAEAQAKAAGVDGRVIHYDFDRDKDVAEMLGVSQIPALLLVKDERVIDRHTGSVGYVAKIQQWLKNPAPQVSRVVRYEAPVRYSRPRYVQPAYQPRTYYRPYSSPSYGGFYGGYSGGCATCR